MNAELAALRARYGELTPLDLGPEGPWFGASLPDGTPVMVLALSGALCAGIGDSVAFEKELKRVSQLRHEELTRLLSWACEGGVYHCEYLRGDMRAPDPGAHSSAEVAYLGARLARALHAAHRAGVSHGGISTPRVRLTEDGSPRLLGLGLIPALIAGGMEPKAVYTEVCDALYLSPEQQAGEPPSPQSDVYALGATLYELLTGKPPFGGRTTSYVMATVLPEEPTSGADQATSADVVIHALLRAIEHEPEDRWPNTHALADALAATVGSPEERNAGRPTSARLHGLRARFAAILQHAWFPAGRSRE